MCLIPRSLRSAVAAEVQPACRWVVPVEAAVCIELAYIAVAEAAGSLACLRCPLVGIWKWVGAWAFLAPPLLSTELLYTETKRFI